MKQLSIKLACTTHAHIYESIFGDLYIYVYIYIHLYTGTCTCTCICVLHISVNVRMYLRMYMNVSCVNNILCIYNMINNIELFLFIIQVHFIHLPKDIYKNLYRTLYYNAIGSLPPQHLYIYMLIHIFTHITESKFKCESSHRWIVTKGLLR